MVHYIKYLTLSRLGLRNAGITDYVLNLTTCFPFLDTCQFGPNFKFLHPQRHKINLNIIVAVGFDNICPFNPMKVFYIVLVLCILQCAKAAVNIEEIELKHVRGYALFKSRIGDVHIVGSQRAISYV